MSENSWHIQDDCSSNKSFNLTWHKVDDDASDADMAWPANDDDGDDDDMVMIGDG